jgi:Ca2+-binding EF-hand superfamily protein
VERDELSRLTEALGKQFDENQLDQMMTILDTDQDGKVSPGEFKKWYRSIKKNLGRLSVKEFINWCDSIKLL